MKQIKTDFEQKIEDYTNEGPLIQYLKDKEYEEEYVFPKKYRNLVEFMQKHIVKEYSDNETQKMDEELIELKQGFVKINEILTIKASSPIESSITAITNLKNENKNMRLQMVQLNDEIERLNKLLKKYIENVDTFIELNGNGEMF